MQLEGSCHCGAVRFTVESLAPYPYMHCYCGICRKTAGGAYAINIIGEADTLHVEGAEHIKTYQAQASQTESHEGMGLSPAKRHFCDTCGSFLYVADDRWPQWVYPFASAIDTELPTPPERVHIMLDFKPSWIEVPSHEERFARYPDASIVEWHKRHDLYEGD